MPRGLQRLPACARPATRRQPVRQRAAQCLSEATWQSVGGRATRPPRPVDQGHAPHPTAQRPALRLGAPDGRMPDATSASGRWGNGQALQPRARGAGLRRLPGAGERARLGAQRAAGTLFSLARRRQVHELLVRPRTAPPREESGCRQSATRALGRGCTRKRVPPRLPRTRDTEKAEPARPLALDAILCLPIRGPEAARCEPSGRAFEPLSLRKAEICRLCGQSLLMRAPSHWRESARGALCAAVQQ